MWYFQIPHTVDCIYPWTLALKTCFQLTSNVCVSGVKLYVTSNVYVSGVKLWNFATYQWFSQVFPIFSRLRWQWTTRALTLSRELHVWAEKFKVWHLKYRRLRSRKLKLGWENFKVWHLKHRRLASVENMFLARAFTGRCNRRYCVCWINYADYSFRTTKRLKSQNCTAKQD